MANFNVKPESADFPSGLSSIFQINKNVHTTLTKVDCDSFPKLVVNVKCIAEVKTFETNSKCGKL